MPMAVSGKMVDTINTSGFKGETFLQEKHKERKGTSLLNPHAEQPRPRAYKKGMKKGWLKIKHITLKNYRYKGSYRSVLKSRGSISSTCYRNKHKHKHKHNNNNNRRKWKCSRTSSVYLHPRFSPPVM